MLFNDNTLQRFWAKVNKNGPLFDGTPCWLWTAYLDPEGYGRLFYVDAQHYAHRISYEMLVGPIPIGLTIDHLCRVRHCVNPLHLEPVTRGQNVLRGSGYAATNARATHCPQNHPYDETNTLIERTKMGAFTRRRCKTCRRIYQRKWRQSVKLRRVLT